jgi:hypothetical protein
LGAFQVLGFFPKSQCLCCFLFQLPFFLRLSDQVWNVQSSRLTTKAFFLLASKLELVLKWAFRVPGDFLFSPTLHGPPILVFGWGAYCWNFGVHEHPPCPGRVWSLPVSSWCSRLRASQLCSPLNLLCDLVIVSCCPAERGRLFISLLKNIWKSAVFSLQIMYNGQPITKMACGAEFSMVMDCKGNLYSFGCPEYGQLGMQIHFFKGPVI